ncbi:MAG TPA: acyltransferase [Bacteroidales bacterium]|nr:acyltransferase [Bacteroidales bacterium]
MANFSEDIKSKSTERIYFPELDGLRFLAFFMVFIVHHSLFSSIPFLSFLSANGWIGVDLFFVLSAFLFTKLLIAEHEKTGTISFMKFYIRRIFRIWPIYFIMIGFSVAVFALAKHEPLDAIAKTRIIGLLTFSDNIMAAIYSGFNHLPFSFHLWTIGYEEQFYVIIPVIILLLVRSSPKVKVITFISTIVVLNAIRIWFLEDKVPYPAIYVLPITHFEAIIFGIAIGFGGFSFLKKFSPILIGATGIIFFALLCILPNVEFIISYWQVVSYFCVGMSTALILYAVLSSDKLKSFFSHKILVFLGKRSYGLYVYHLFGIKMVDALAPRISAFATNAYLTFICSMLLTILLSVASYHFIEKPFLVLKKRFEIITSRPV